MVLCSLKGGRHMNKIPVVPYVLCSGAIGILAAYKVGISYGTNYGVGWGVLLGLAAFFIAVFIAVGLLAAVEFYLGPDE